MIPSDCSGRHQQPYVRGAGLVDKSKLEEGTVELECVHGDLVSYLTAQITLKIINLEGLHIS